MNIRVLYNCLLVRLGIREVLPIDYIQTIKLRECNEPLQSLSEDFPIFYDKQLPMEGRKSVVEKLERIAVKLKDEQGLYLYVHELYRSPEKQRLMRENRIKIIQESSVGLSDENISTLANKQVARVGGGHQTGGAVDLTLCNSNGIPLDMGTAYSEFNVMTPTHSKCLSPKQKANRKILCEYMKHEGFVNYPNEWWHFSYGDKSWAAYSRKKYAIYGFLNK